MSKMKKDFETKSALRCMADGGIAGLAGQRQRVLDQAENAAVKGTPAPAAPTPVARPPTDQEQAKSVGISIPAAPPPKPVEKPGVIGTLRKMVGLANGGDPWASMYAAKPAAAAMPTAANPVTVNPAAAPAAPAATPMAAPVAAAPTHSVATANVNFATPDQTRGVDWAGSSTMKMSPTGYPTGLRRGGEVKGPGGPREDKVGPFMLSDGEYVLPAKTVEAMGGKEELDEVVRSTNGREPGATFKKGLRGAARGVFAVAPDGTATWEPQKLLPAPGSNSTEIVKTPRMRPAPGFQPSGPTINMGGPEVPRLPPPAPPEVINTQRPTGPIEPKFTPNPDGTMNPRQAAFQEAQMNSARESILRESTGGRMTDVKNAARTRLDALKGMGGKVMGGAAKLAAPIALGTSAAQTAGTETEDYRTRFGNPEYLRPVKGDTDEMVFGKDLATRALGGLSDLANVATFGLAGNFYADKQAKAAQANLTTKGDAAMQGPPVGEAPITTKVAMGLRDKDLDTNGEIRQVPGENTYYGGVDPVKAAQLQEIEAQRGRERYSRDAQGMYAAIQGHIANGDIETANKLAWDPQSRAIVNQAYADRKAAMASANRPNPEDTINARYDKQEEGLRRRFSSDRAQGNLAKHLDALNATRAGELSRFRETETQRRGQDTLAANARSKQASDEAIAQQRNSLDRQKMMQEQMNKDRDFQLNASKYGTEVAKMLFDQKQATHEKNIAHIDKFLAGQFTNLLGKEDRETTARASQFLQSKVGNLADLSPEERGPVLSKFLTEFKMQEAKNKSAGPFTGKKSAEYRPIVETRGPELADVKRGVGPLDLAAAYAKKYTFGNSDIAVDDTGQARAVSSLTDGGNDQDALERIYPGLRRK